jgi:hypothetical protein
MKHRIVLIIVLISAISVYGQKYGNVWQFGDSIGLDFNNCDPILINGCNIGDEGCSSISDNNGQLLFYTNSDSVWNKFHMVMPNGNLNHTGSISQVLIISKPLSSTEYYIITANVQGGYFPSISFPLHYHIVDMSLNNGLGDVLSKNNILSSLTVTEQICATYHSNGTDIWLMTHEYGSSNFLAFLVTSSGISTSPIISSVGPASIPYIGGLGSRGELKFSPDGKKLAFNGNGFPTADDANILTINDFDNSTGQVSNSINLPFSRGEYGLSFSPDNSKLYCSTIKAYNSPQTISNDHNYLYQFDLSSGISNDIINSKKIIDSLQVPKSYGSLKIGPNGKIYIRYNVSLQMGSNYLGVINLPNNTGTFCNYIKEGFSLGNKIQNWQTGLNNYIEYTEYCSNTGISSNTKNENQSIIYPNPFSSKTVIYTSNILINASVLIYDFRGQIVKESNNLNGQIINLECDELSSGLYFMRLINNNIEISTNKLFINK